MSTTATVIPDFNHASSDPADASPLADRFDRLGIFASLACAVHCLIAPFLLLLLPAAGSIWAHPSVHWVLAALVLPLALVVVFRGYRLHRRRSALVSAVLGTAFIVAGLVVPMMKIDASAATLQLGHTPSTVGAATCTEACCPSVTVDAQTGAMGLAIPLGSSVTMIGSLLLITAHGINLHGCHCFSRKRDASDSSCGCPERCGIM